MIYFVFMYFVISYVSTDVKTQSQESPCKTPYGAEGRCVSIYKCQELLELLRNDSSAADMQLLKESQCEYTGNDPKVCCPDTCFTPQGRPGRCIDIYSCSHLADHLRNNENVEFVKKSRCTGREDRSVCCGPPIPPPEVGSCADTISAFPPDPASGCCGVGIQLDNRILGGTETAADKYPWMAVIEYVSPGNRLKFLCSGSLVSGRYVLTAAHCITGRVYESGTPKYVRLGEYNTTNEGPDCVKENDYDVCTYGAYRVPIERTIPHPSYKQNGMGYDVALIRLRNMAPYSAFIRPICLPRADYTVNPPEEFNLFVSGWGRYIQSLEGILWTGKASEIKRSVQVPFVDITTCNSTYFANFHRKLLPKEHLCAGGDDGKGTCNGDSGSPLMYDNNQIHEVVGVLNFGPKECGIKGMPSVYSTVYEYLPWIRSTIIE